MPLSDQAVGPRGTLCAFLEARLPGRDVVVERLRPAPGPVLDVDAGHARLGTALEVRLGPDLADEPAHRGLLSFLPAERCRALLAAREADEDHPVFRGLLHMWRDHLRHARAELRQAIGKEFDDAASRRFHDRHPAPATATTPAGRS